MKRIENQRKLIENQRKLLFLFLIFCGCFCTINAQSDSIPTEKKSLIQHVEKWYEENMNYATITLLMTVESSFIPFPSEVVIPPAAYIALKPESNLNIFLVVLFGTLGALLGALANYFLAISLGRKIVYRFADSKLGRLCLLNGEKVKKAEDYFNKNGNISTFVCRFIPGIRQLISIPAGLARMNLASFCIYTTLGAGIWNVILALLGYIAHGQTKLINEYSHELSIIILALAGVVILYFVIRYFVKKNRKSKI